MLFTNTKRGLVACVMLAGGALGPFGLFAQNLVPNNSFEEFTVDCSGFVAYDELSNWRIINCANSPGTGNECSGNVPYSSVGFQYAQDGESFIVINPFVMNMNGVPGNPQTYANIDLVEPLVAGEEYCLSLWMNMADSANYRTGSLSAYLWYGWPSVCNYNDTAWDTYSDVTFDISQVDTAEWTFLEASFIASGAEVNLSLGAFQFGEEIDTTFIHHTNNFEGDLAMYFIDNVYLGPCNVGIGISESSSGPSISVYPTPANNILFIELREAVISLEIIDVLGRSVTPLTSTNLSIETRQLDVSGLAPNTYMLVARSANGESMTKRFVIAR